MTSMNTAPGGPGSSGVAAPPPSGARPDRPRGGRWTVRPRGVWLVTSLELRQRLRSVAWYVALGVWTVVLAGIGVLGLAPTLYTAQYGAYQETAQIIFSLQMILVLFAMLLVVPAMSAGSINGDRSAGTLATLQASLLGPLEIVLGKLLAGWLTGLAFLVLALPSTLPTALLAGISVFYLARVILMIALLAGCVTALGLGLSSLTRRAMGSVVLAYVIVVGVTVVLPIVWGVSALFLVQERTVTVHEPDYYSSTYEDSTGKCIEVEQEQSVSRTDIAMPLLWANPLVMLADVSPRINSIDDYDGIQDYDVLMLMKQGLRLAASPTHPTNFNYCSPDMTGYPADLGDPIERPVWPMGAGLWIIVSVASVAIATSRLGIPIKRLGKGTRIA